MEILALEIPTRVGGLDLNFEFKSSNDFGFEHVSCQMEISLVEKLPIGNQDSDGEFPNGIQFYTGLRLSYGRDSGYGSRPSYKI